MYKKYKDAPIKCPVCNETTIKKCAHICKVCGWQREMDEADNHDEEPFFNKLTINETKLYIKLKRKLNPDYKWFDFGMYVGNPVKDDLKQLKKLVEQFKQEDNAIVCPICMLSILNEQAYKCNECGWLKDLDQAGNHKLKIGKNKLSVYEYRKFKDLQGYSKSVFDWYDNPIHYEQPNLQQLKKMEKLEKYFNKKRNFKKELCRSCREEIINEDLQVCNNCGWFRNDDAIWEGNPHNDYNILPLSEYAELYALKKILNPNYIWCEHYLPVENFIKEDLLEAREKVAIKKDSN